MNTLSERIVPSLCARLKQEFSAAKKHKKRKSLIQAVSCGFGAFSLPMFQWGKLAAILFLLVLISLSTSTARAQAGRIYTKTIVTDTGGIVGKIPCNLSHAMAVEHDHVRVYLAELADAGKTFRFEHLPVGKYDLVLVSKNGEIFDGLALGDKPSELSAASAANLETRIKSADSFFKECTIHREGISGLDGSGDAVVLALAERLRANDVLKQSGEKLNEMVRRMEIIELHQATDDWQMTATRHLYRESEPIIANPQFFKNVVVPELGNIRVVDAVKDLGSITLPAN